MAAPTYSELLKDPRWQRKRLEIFERDNWTCQWCGDKSKTLAVHHKQYIRGKKPWEYENSYLLTVCDDCHSFDYDFRPGFEQKLISTLRLAGIEATSLAALSDCFPTDLSPKEAEDLMWLLMHIAAYFHNSGMRKALFAQFGLIATSESKGTMVRAGWRLAEVGEGIGEETGSTQDGQGKRS